LLLKYAANAFFFSMRVFLMSTKKNGIYFAAITLLVPINELIFLHSEAREEKTSLCLCGKKKSSFFFFFDVVDVFHIFFLALSCQFLTP